MGGHDGATANRFAIRHCAAIARPATQRPGAARWLAARWLSRLRRGPVRVGVKKVDSTITERMKSLRETATEIVRRLQSAGFAAFWVGGCVRDVLLGRQPEDYDVVTAALPDQVEKLFARTIAVGKKFGVMVVVESDHQFQVATFRAEADYQDGRRPNQVTFGDAHADALRRDFTVNGLFYDPIQKHSHDWVGGEADLRAKLIRTIGSPAERFAEDHLRLLRAVRFAAQLDFRIEPETFAALKANAPKICGISAERIR